jgi:hypothetical protein
MCLRPYRKSTRTTNCLNVLAISVLVVLGNAADTPDGGQDSTEEEPPGYFGDDRDDLDGASFLLFLVLAIGPMVILCCIWKVRRVRSERRRNLFVNDQAEIRRRATEQMVVARRAQAFRDQERQRQHGDNLGSGIGIPFENQHVDELRMHSLVIDCLFPEHKVRYSHGCPNALFVILDIYVQPILIRTYLPHHRVAFKK